MILVFNGGTEIVKLDINRETKKLLLTSSKTRYKPADLPWNSLFDTGQEELQDEVTSLMSDQTFKDCVIEAMTKAGYNLTGEE